MPKSKRPPAYRFHKARNFAVVTIGGKNHYLGRFGSPESHEKYARLIAASRVTPMPAITPASDGSLPTSAVILGYLDFADRYYRKHGQPTGEFKNIRVPWQH